MTPSLRVLLVDDHSLVRAGFHSLLEQIKGVEVIGEARSGEEALALVAENAPDLVCLDIGMPGMNGLEVLSRITADHPDVRVVMLSMHPDEEYVLAALEGGAAGYMLKEAEAPELEQCVGAIARGDRYLSPRVSQSLLDNYVRRTRGQPPAPPSAEKEPSEVLTARQLEVLRLLVTGRTTRQIARDLGVSAKTVETHRANLMDRLAIHDIPGLVMYAIRAGLLSADDSARVSKHRAAASPGRVALRIVK